MIKVKHSKSPSERIACQFSDDNTVQNLSLRYPVPFKTEISQFAEMKTAIITLQKLFMFVILLLTYVCVNCRKLS